MLVYSGNNLKYQTNWQIDQYKDKHNQLHMSTYVMCHGMLLPRTSPT